MQVATNKLKQTPFFETILELSISLKIYFGSKWNLPQDLLHKEAMLEPPTCYNQIRFADFEFDLINPNLTLSNGITI